MKKMDSREKIFSKFTTGRSKSIKKVMTSIFILISSLQDRLNLEFTYIVAKKYLIAGV